MRAAARDPPLVRRPSVSAAGGNLEIGRIHFGRFESNHGVPGESGAFSGASSSIKPDNVRGAILAIIKTPFRWDAGCCPGMVRLEKREVVHSRYSADGNGRI